MFKVKWPRNKKRVNKTDNYQTDWPSYYQSYYPDKQKGPGGKKGRRGLVTRTVVTVCLLALILAVREAPLPVGQQARETVRYLLTAEWNFEPLMQGAVRVASQIVNWDNPMFHNWPNAGPVQPVVAEGMWVPVSGKVVCEFGWSENPIDGLKRFHPGVDIQAEQGTPVRAVMDGQVVLVQEDTRLGKYILINHGGGCYTMYAGLQNILVNKGKWVSAGEEIGEVGVKSDVPQGGLHFEMREKDDLVNPLDRLQMGK
ncbi:MAG: M23 family peptidase [Firmicutes bacterium]|nr:M23 family peptidase [Bacillota bacterium]